MLRHDMSCKVTDEACNVTEGVTQEPVVAGGSAGGSRAMAVEGWRRRGQHKKEETAWRASEWTVTCVRY